MVSRGTVMAAIFYDSPSQIPFCFFSLVGYTKEKQIKCGQLLFLMGHNANFCFFNLFLVIHGGGGGGLLFLMGHNKLSGGSCYSLWDTMQTSSIFSYTLGGGGGGSKLSGGSCYSLWDTMLSVSCKH